MLLMSLYDPSAKMSMANTAEELGRRYQITRAQADQFAYRSNVLAAKARKAGAFDEEIAPVSVTFDAAEPPLAVRADTHVLEEPSLDKMARLPAAFEPGGIITAANASAVVDGAGARVIGKKDAPEDGLRPLARLAGLPWPRPRIWAGAPLPSRSVPPDPGSAIDQRAQRGVRLQRWRASATSRASASPPTRSTRRAAPSRSAIPSAPPARSSR
jgi:hypothetical protein